MKLALSQIMVDPGLQARAGGVDTTLAQEYGEALKRGEKLPPVVVFEENHGLDPAYAAGLNEVFPKYWLADGFHRVAGAKFAELAEIEVEVRLGGRREALLYSVGANASHGLRRTQADKRKAVLTLLEDAEWRERSDRWIAEAARVSDKTVGTLRKELGTSGAEFRTSRRSGRDGKVYDLADRGKALGLIASDGRLTPEGESLTKGERLAIIQDAPALVADVPLFDPYLEFRRRFDSLMESVPEEKRHLLAVQLRNLADDNDPEFQEQQRAIAMKNQELRLKSGKRRNK